MNIDKFFLEDELVTARTEIAYLKEDLRLADGYFINSSNKLLAAEKEIDELKQRLRDIKEGFEGCCYACEPVGILNQELEAQLKCIQEDGTEEHNAAIELRVKLAEALLELEAKSNTFAVCEETHYALEECRFRNLQLEKDISDTDDLKSQITSLYSILSKTDALWHQSEEKERKWEEVATKLYSVALHLEEVAKSSLVVVVGPGLYSEAVDAIKEYKKIQND